MPATGDLLAEADRCVMAVRGRLGPLLSPMACWWDGAGLWMTTPAGSTKVTALRRHPSCAAWIAPREVGGPGALVRGRARVFGLDDPVGLALHGPSITGAVMALAARSAPQIIGYVQDAPRVPVRFWPRNRVVIRLTAERIKGVTPPDPGPGMAPPLPTVVPPAVRRLLGGERRLVVGTVGDDGVEVEPGAWGAGFTMTFAAGLAPPVGAPLAVLVNTEPGVRPTQVAGLVLHGQHEPAGKLALQRATWWHGFDLQSAPVSDPAAGRGIELPD